MHHREIIVNEKPKKKVTNIIYNIILNIQLIAQCFIIKIH